MDHTHLHLFVFELSLQYSTTLTRPGQRAFSYSGPQKPLARVKILARGGDATGQD
jgi:hypothetical protein